MKIILARLCEIAYLPYLENTGILFYSSYYLTEATNFLKNVYSIPYFEDPSVTTVQVYFDVNQLEDIDMVIRLSKFNPHIIKSIFHFRCVKELIIVAIGLF